jgi:hypothetical protein
VIFDDAAWTAGQIDTGTAQAARVYDYWLGGKDNYAADRDLAETVSALAPQVPDTARANRAFLRRAVRYAVWEAGVAQLLDVGCGMPTRGDACSTARIVNSAVRVVAVDNDPIVVTHGRALLAGGDPAGTAAAFGDLRDPAAILDDPGVRRVLDFSRPIVLVLGAVLHFLADYEHPGAVLRTLTDALAPGSLLVVSHATADVDPAGAMWAAEAYNDGAAVPVTLRTAAGVTALLGSWRLLAPGLVPLNMWRPNPSEYPNGVAWAYSTVAVKPPPDAAAPHAPATARPHPRLRQGPDESVHDDSAAAAHSGWPQPFGPFAICVPAS